jgi:hypothetical protein
LGTAAIYKPLEGDDEYVNETKYDFVKDEKCLTFTAADDEFEDDPEDIVKIEPVKKQWVLQSIMMNDDYVECHCRNDCCGIFEFHEMALCWAKCVGQYIARTCRTDYEHWRCTVTVSLTLSSKPHGHLIITLISS